MKPEVTKNAIIAFSVIIIAAFLMPWVTIFVRISAWDMVFGAIGDEINSPLRYLLTIIPISAAIIIYCIINKQKYILRKDLLFSLPLVTLIVTFFVIINKLDNGNLNDIKWDEFIKLFNVGFWLTLVSSGLLLITGLKNTGPFSQINIDQTPLVAGSNMQINEPDISGSPSPVNTVSAPSVTPVNKSAFQEPHNQLLAASALIFVGFFMPWVNVDINHFFNSFVPTINGTYLLSETDHLYSYGFLAKIALLLIPLSSGIIAYKAYHKKLLEKAIVPFISLATIIPVFMLIVSFSGDNSDNARVLKSFVGNYISLGSGMLMMIAGSLYYLYHAIHHIIKNNKLIIAGSFLKYSIVGGVISGTIYYVVLVNTNLSNYNGSYLGSIITMVYITILIIIYLHKISLNNKINYSRIIIIAFVCSIVYMITIYLLFNIFRSNHFNYIPGISYLFLLFTYIIVHLSFIFSSIAGISMANIASNYVLPTVIQEKSTSTENDAPELSEKIKALEAKNPFTVVFFTMSALVKKYKYVFIATAAIIIIGIGLKFILKPDPVKEAKKAIDMRCNCIDKKTSEYIAIYQDFLKSFDLQNFKRRKEAKAKIDELIQKANLNDTICANDAIQKEQLLRNKFNDDYLELGKFNNVINSQLNLYHSPNETKKNSLLSQINSKILTIQDPEPDSNSIKTDLIGRAIPGWNFSFISEFKQVQIVSITKVPNRIDYIVNFKLNGQGDGNLIHEAQVLITYSYNDDQWVLVSNVEIYYTCDYILPPDNYVNVCTVADCNWSVPGTYKIAWKIGNYGPEYQSGPDIGAITLPPSDCYLMKSREAGSVTVRFTYKPK